MCIYVCVCICTQTTLTTTGYGDVTPITWQGRAVAGVLMLTAIVTLALPISVVGANFTNMWTDYKTMREAAARSQHVWENLSQLIAQVCEDTTHTHTHTRANTYF